MARFHRLLLFRLICVSVLFAFSAADLLADERRLNAGVVPFGDAGKFKMLYDARQRPQSVFVNGQLYVVYNGDATSTSNDKGRARPMMVRYHPQDRVFSKPQRLGPANSDHHFSPIIWADNEDCLHVLYGCHLTPGTHLISEHPVRSDTSAVSWREGPEIAPSLSYPSVFRIRGDRELVYYRTSGHTSSWTYRISEDDGQTWVGPAMDVIDLDRKGRLDWSSYQTKLPSKDGEVLHVVYTDYDDNKNAPDPKRFFNPRYDQEVTNEWKYNLSYVAIDLRNHTVRNASGELLTTPIDIDYSKRKCQIWDTQWRGAGVPPAICIDPQGNPAFLHVLSGDNLKSHRYFYVCRRDGIWVKTPICASSHQWNSGHLRFDQNGQLHAYVVAGESYLEGGYMNRHGGGRIEEWISKDDGKTWKKDRQISPPQRSFTGWRFNNVQPVVRPDGTEVEGMLLFYGWQDESEPDAKAFLLHE
ncbi:MAG: BNR-4 repeat-containing protein [Rubripirellula sp.]|nr:BNR-4 repeat-containing protein [Rubripirellula sp.]